MFVEFILKFITLTQVVFRGTRHVTLARGTRERFLKVEVAPRALSSGPV